MVINRFQRWLAASLVVSAVSIFTLAPASAERLRGTVSIDGSSTVFPISEAVAEEFLAVQPRVRVTVGVSGTGGGFKKFLAGEIDINDASRPIKMKEVKQVFSNKKKSPDLHLYNYRRRPGNQNRTCPSTCTLPPLLQRWL